MQSDVPMPDKIAALPRDDLGRPVPWFVHHVDGEPEFRVIRPNGIALAVREQRCWICGKLRFGVTAQAFVVGPMCAVNRVSSEPPSHLACAIYAARVCPFLANPSKRRREGNLPDGHHDPGGVMIRRNPGVALVWLSKRWTTRRVSNGVLFDIGVPREVHWFHEGRAATHDEVLASIDSGLPALIDVANNEGPDARVVLDVQLAEALKFVPPEEAHDG